MTACKLAASCAGVHASQDGASVATPVSIMEWFLDFWEEVEQGAVQPLQGTVGPGEVLFVPSGWWHLALNLEVRSTMEHARGCTFQRQDQALCLLSQRSAWSAGSDAMNSMPQRTPLSESAANHCLMSGCQRRRPWQ